MGEIRTFDTGATRDTDMGKNDYEGFLSPFVLERFGDYMTKHRKQSDGSLRDSDNWQKGFGIGEKHFQTCIKSMWRHLLDVWFIHRGHYRFDKQRNEEITIDEALCALLFNVMAYLHQYLINMAKDKQNISLKQKLINNSENGK
jgi:hypothetical protein